MGMTWVWTPGWENELDASTFPMMRHLMARAESHGKRMAPVDVGSLRISVKGTAIGKAGVLYAYGGTGGRAYAEYVERGTRYMRAQPYLRPAVILAGAELG